MRVVCDIECNGLEDPDKVWLVGCKDIDTGEIHVFREPSDNPQQAAAFRAFAARVDHWIGHNWLGYDYPNLERLLGLDIPEIWTKCTDTLIASKAIDYSRSGGHSLDTYGEELGYPKGVPLGNTIIPINKIPYSFYSKYSIDLENYCIRDLEITHKVYLKYIKYIYNTLRKPSLELEYRFQLICNKLHTNGFTFNTLKGKKLLEEVENELSSLDLEIKEAFPPRLKPVKVVTPKATKHGTISLSSIPKKIRDMEQGDLSAYSVDAPFSFCSWVEFNPSSHKQIIEILNEAKWGPVNKTKTHIDIERELNITKRNLRRLGDVDLKDTKLYTRIMELRKSGWKVDETNLETLPSSAPAPARALARRILLESRRRTLTEWLSLVRDDGRIHGRFQGIGAWTHRMAHQEPNTANIPNEFDTAGNKKLLGKEMRSLWTVPRNRLLVGVDAEGIQLRIFAHYIDDPEFTDALVRGRKDDKTDPHSLNARILGDVCKSRAAAKRFIYALLLGAGIGKLAEILGCSIDEAKRALDRLLERYQGFALLKENTIPADAKKGWFLGLDGRAVKIPGDTASERRHLCMSGYLQNGEAVCMKRAAIKWHEQLEAMPELGRWMLVNFVHDEWQTETKNDWHAAKKIAEIQADSLRLVGEELNLKCPLAGSYWNDDLKDYTIGTNWAVTH